MDSLPSCDIKLDHSVGSPDPLPHWRQAPGFPVFGVGQPTEQGYSKLGEIFKAEQPVIWFNVRREPVAYVGGLPVAPRLQGKPHYNIQVPADQVDGAQAAFVKAVQGKVADGEVEVHMDKESAENPMDREDIITKVKTGEVFSMKEIFTGLNETTFPNLKLVTVPFEESRALPESCFDSIVGALCGENAATTSCVFSSQLGQGRSSLGMVVASILKAVQMITKLNKMVEAGMAERAWADNIIKCKFEEPSASEDNKDPFKRGEFDVIKELLEKYPEMRLAKVLADKMIDICGVPPEGTGMQNLRKAVIEMKYKYDGSTEDKQVVWKDMIVNFLERYFYIICFTSYVKEQEPQEFKQTFVAWLDARKELRDMIEQGKDKLEWTRKVDQGKVAALRDMIQGPDYKDKLGALVSQLYKLAFETYSDIQRGPIKDNLMRKLACKTLMEILPAEVSSNVQKELVEKKLSVDFDTVVGLVVG